MEKLNSLFQKAIADVNIVVLGKSSQVEKIFIALLAAGHVLLDDTPGMGKTTLARSLASVLGMSFHRIQFTSDLMPSDITGINTVPSLQSAAPLQFQPGPLFANMVLADEINRASPRTQSALLEAMAERQATVDGQTHELPNPFWVVATQNPIDLSGTFALPDSQMDRFLFRMNMGYPDKKDEMDLMTGRGGNTHILAPVLHAQDVLTAQSLVERVDLSPRVAEYIYRLVERTRSHPKVHTGISPRGTLALVKASKASAWLRGSSFVTPDDVQKIFNDCSAHRLHTNHLNFSDRQKITTEILSETPAS